MGHTTPTRGSRADLLTTDLGFLRAQDLDRPTRLSSEAGLRPDTEGQQMREGLPKNQFPLPTRAQPGSLCSCRVRTRSSRQAVGKITSSAPARQTLPVIFQLQPVPDAMTEVEGSRREKQKPALSGGIRPAVHWEGEPC